MELGVEALGQEQQQAEARDAVPLGDVGGQDVGGQLVEGLELLDVAGEGGGVAGADGKEGALLVRLAGEGEDVLGRGGARGERVELEEGELGLGEEGVGLGVAHGGGVLELAEDLGEVAVGHGG